MPSTTPAFVGHTRMPSPYARCAACIRRRLSLREPQVGRAERLHPDDFRANPAHRASPGRGRPAAVPCSSRRGRTACRRAAGAARGSTCPATRPRRSTAFLFGIVARRSGPFADGPGQLAGFEIDGRQPAELDFLLIRAEIHADAAAEHGSRLRHRFVRRHGHVVDEVDPLAVVAERADESRFRTGRRPDRVPVDDSDSCTTDRASSSARWCGPCRAGFRRSASSRASRRP